MRFQVRNEHASVGLCPFMKGWTAEIVIDAPRELVWEQVTNFDAYSEWNPFVLEAHTQV